MIGLKRTLLFVALLSGSLLFAQSPQKFTLSGTIKDSASGEQLIGVTIEVKELPGTGEATNNYGYYSITLNEGNYTILYNYLGYKTDSLKISLHHNIKHNVNLAQAGAALEEVSVHATKANANVTSAQTGMVELDVKAISKIPVFFGEKDVLKTVELIPGVVSAGDGNSGFYVRGGAADQNLILLDEATVYNAYHLLGFFSVFNSDALKDVTLYKSGMPVEYGGRLASVEDVRMNDGNDQTYHVSGGIGLISSRLSFEGPIKKGKGSFLISGRRTYADLFLKLSTNSDLKNSSLYFYDFNAKGNYTLGENDRIYISGYFGKDALGIDNLFGINWGNATATLRWNHIYGAKLFSNTSLIFSNYDYNVDINTAGIDLGIQSTIRDWNLKEEFQYYPNSKNKIIFGFSSTYHTIVPGNIVSLDSNIKNTNIQTRYAWDNSVFASDEFKVSDRLKFVAGLRVTSFSLLGPGTFYTYNSEGNITDSAKYSSGQFVKTYINPEPRFNASYMLDEFSSIKASYDRNVQNMHLLSNSTSSNPTNLWVPSSNNIQPEIADQVSVGYYRNFLNNQYEFSVETYYKFMQNQIDYKNGAQLELNENVESELLFGHGKSYGAEFFLKRKYGKLTGWIGYTLSKTELQIPGINNGDWYPATQDITNAVDVVAIYELSEKWSFSATFIYNTGYPVTFPSGKYEVDGNILYYYTSRNDYRMPAYNRMDVGATYKCKKHKHYQADWSFSIYNVYDRWNAYTITFQQNPNNSQETQAVLTSLFGIIPSISYDFKF
jgi:CarboxypepD_reg-like domain/TonB-dependent Receptor Plug Domain